MDRAGTENGKTGMGRPREFDSEKAIDAALHVFWREGYDGAGLADLLDAMGIQRGSLYKAYGSKKGLFLAALDRYREVYVAPGAVWLAEGPGSGLDRITQAMRSSPARNLGRGCFLCNAAAGPAADDPEISVTVNAQLDLLRTGFRAALAQDRTDAAPEAVAAEADRLTREYMGRQVSARSAWETPTTSG